jgi:hypothetical protein
VRLGTVLSSVFFVISVTLSKTLETWPDSRASRIRPVLRRKLHSALIAHCMSSHLDDNGNLTIACSQTTVDVCIAPSRKSKNSVARPPRSRIVPVQASSGGDQAKRVAARRGDFPITSFLDRPRARPQSMPGIGCARINRSCRTQTPCSASIEITNLVAEFRHPGNNNRRR